MNVLEAAKRLNVSPQFIRIGLQQKRLPFGTAVKMSSRWSYHISEKLLDDYLKGSDLTDKTISAPTGSVGAN